MKYLIFADFNEFSARLDKCNLDAQKLFTDDITECYCDITKHPEKELYALPIDDRYLSIFTELEISQAVNLDESWTPKRDINFK